MEWCRLCHQVGTHALASQNDKSAVIICLQLCYKQSRKRDEAIHPPKICLCIHERRPIPRARLGCDRMQCCKHTLLCKFILISFTEVDESARESFDPETSCFCRHTNGSKRPPNKDTMKCSRNIPGFPLSVRTAACTKVCNPTGGRWFCF